MATNAVNFSLDYTKTSPKVIFESIKNIPSEPRISLKNYLLDLVSESDGKESSIYLKGIEKIIQEIWKEMITNNWRKLRVEIPKVLKIHPMSFYAYKNGRKAISIQMMHKLLLLWKVYCQKSDENVKEKWNEIYKSDFTFSVHKASAPTKLPKCLSPKLSYFIGWLCGDGHMTDCGSHYLINTTDKSINQLEYVLRPLFKQLFNIEFPLFIYPSKNILQIGSKPIFRFLTQVFKIRVGEIPPNIKGLDWVNKKYFLMGIFDSEGNVDTSYLNSKIVISQASYKFLEELIGLFKDLNIYFTGPHLHKTKLGTWYTIQIRKKFEILKYIKEIGSCHVDKFQKIKFLEKEIYAHGYSYVTA